MAMSLETRPKAENISRPKNRLTHAGSHQRHVTCERQMALPIHRFFGCLSSAPLRRTLLQIAIASNASETCFIKTIRLPWPAVGRPLEGKPGQSREAPKRQFVKGFP
jgi:hypothetical protein